MNFICLKILILKTEIFYRKEKVNILELFIEKDIDNNGMISSEDT